MQASVTPTNYRHRVISSELFNNARGDGQFESLGLRADQANRIAFDHWPQIVRSDRKFPAAAEWRTPPTYHARMIVLQANGHSILMESNKLTLRSPSRQSLASTADLT